MKGKKILVLAGGALVVAAIWFFATLQIKGTKERYCLNQTHKQYGKDAPMEGVKWDYFGSCYNSLNLVDAFKIILGKLDNISTSLDKNSEQEGEDLVAIKNFMGNSDLELAYIGTDFPQPYFMVGKVSELEKGGGIKIEHVEDWKRTVNVYEQTDIIDDRCAVYEFHTDARNHKLISVRIRNLKSSEIEALDTPCSETNNQMPVVSKSDAEAVAMAYLNRALPESDQIIKDEFSYSQKSGGQSHEWKWEDVDYELPEGLAGDPYSHPIIRIVVYGDGTIQYENTTSLFEN